MKYSEVLCSYPPVEIGDFMRRYRIGDREYILYSPKQGQISCLELHDFKDLTPYQLAVLIQTPQKGKTDTQEFSFDHVCSKEDLISYLFDVASEKTEYRKVRKVSNNEGYFLYESKPSHKIRNFYQFNPESGEYQLVFDNESCLTSIHENTGSDAINICWDPVTFSRLENKKEEVSYLLASANSILCSYIMKKVGKRSARINIYPGKDSMKALLFFSYYVTQKGVEKGFSVSYDMKDVIIQMKGWSPISLVKFMSKIQKEINSMLRDRMGEEENDMTIYQLVSVAGASFLVFPHISLAIDVFVRNMVTLLGIDDMAYMEIERF